MTSVSSAADQLSANDPFIIKAYQLLAQNKLQEVATLLNEAQRNTPYDPRIFMLGARLAEQSDKPNEAVEAMEHATRLAPQWWPAHPEPRNGPEPASRAATPGWRAGAPKHSTTSPPCG